VFNSAAVRRELRGIIIALLLVAATTIVAYALIRLLGIRRGSSLYLIPVLIAGMRLGVIPALVAAFAGVIGSGYLFLAPNFLFNRPIEIVNLTLFTVVAIVVSQLANSMNRQTELARTRERQMGELYAFSRRLAAAASSGDIYATIHDHLAYLIQRKVMLFVSAADGTTTTIPIDATVPRQVRDAILQVQEGQAAAALYIRANDSTWFVRNVSQNNPDFGAIAIDLGTQSDASAAEIGRRVDEALVDATATLERLDIARAVNEAKMRTETEFLREALIDSVSHELRTPLASILGAATVLSESPALAADQHLKSLAGVIHGEAERLNGDIQNLLDATRISRNQVHPHKQWMEPVDIVNSAIRRRQRLLTGHRVALDVEKDLPLIYVDAALLEQAFVQVLDNATKYSPAGSTIAVSARRDGQNLVLSVSDRGVGVTEEEKLQLGQRFFRGQRHTRTTPGSGLGLWIATAFVAANGGRLEIASEGAGRGTDVSIHLQVAESEIEDIKARANDQFA
jgi:two-component system sensor histidine kinase KdpD